MIEFLLSLLFVLLFVLGPLLLAAAGVAVGWIVEANHFRRLEEGERQLGHLVVSDLKQLPENWAASDASLVCGEAAIARDSLKSFLAGLRRLVGGRIRAYETLMERARREALLRMLRQAQAAGANAVWNVRVSSSAVGGGERQKTFGVLVIAYGTALKVRGTEA